MPEQMSRPYRRTLRIIVLVTLSILAIGLVTGGIAGAQRTVGPEVEVINPPERPVPVTGDFTSSGRVPVVLGRQINAETQSGLLRDASGENFVVPEGKQLVIEYVSMETVGRALTGNERYLGFLGGAGRRFRAGEVSAANSHFAFGPETGELVPLRFGPGQDVNFIIFSQNFPAEFNLHVNVAVSGYLDDLGE
ncbi:MAG: hypothetical protein GEU74_02255 [Nitriliruptorales bacterium]|nr:hypothetical protein [Nitriliruptorales bacterium]